MTAKETKNKTPPPTTLSAPSLVIIHITPTPSHFANHPAGQLSP